MNLLAFLVLVAAVWSAVLFAMFPEQVENVLSAIAERIRAPRPDPLAELHRHWGVMEGKRDADD